MMDEARARNILDEPAAMARADAAGLLGYVAATPDQAAEGWRITRSLRLPWDQPGSVAVLGMGDAAAGADLARGIWADRITVPLEVLRGYDLPAWVGPETLVIACSRSGATEETLAQLETALSRRCPVVAVTAGGALRRVAEAARLPLAALPDAAVPRTSAATTATAVAGILERAGVLALSDEEVATGVAEAVATVARCEPAVPTAENPAKRLAWSLVDRLVVVMGSGLMAPVARRWKTQLNQNSKTTAMFEELPEATHNTVVGFEQPESLRDHLAVVFLRSGLEHPRDALRTQLVGDLLETGHISHTTVETTGESRLGQALGAVLTGDFVSIYLAFMYAIDPTPVDVVAHIKEQLALADRLGEG